MTLSYCTTRRYKVAAVYLAFTYSTQMITLLHACFSTWKHVFLAPEFLSIIRKPNTPWNTGKGWLKVLAKPTGDGGKIKFP